MTEREPFTITVDGRDMELTYDNHGVAMFRDEPEKDYIDITEEMEGSDELRHTLIFRHRWVCLWMGRVAVLEVDAQAIEELEQEKSNGGG